MLINIATASMVASNLTDPTLMKEVTSVHLKAVAYANSEMLKKPSLLPFHRWMENYHQAHLDFSTTQLN